MSAAMDKRYDLSVLIELCGGTRAAVTETLTWHELRDDGLWVTDPPALLNFVEREVWRWHPRAQRGKPALPVPFTAHELAAFMLAGGGLFLYDRFVGDSHEADATALAAMGANAGEARRAVTEAFKLRSIATVRFCGDEDGREAEVATGREVLVEREVPFGDAVVTGRLRISEAETSCLSAEDERMERADECTRAAAEWLLVGVASVSSELPAVPAETAEQRQARRHQMCIDAGLKMPTNDYARLPSGIGAIAKLEGITRQSLSEDLKAHIRRLGR